MQGVGFRPFVYRLAREYGVLGTVQNRLGEVEIVACGRQALLKRFREALIRRAPPLARPEIVKVLPEDTAAYRDFSILPSAQDAEARVFVPPDYFMCADCAHELSDPADRRYRYPFINCTQCGPRYTLIEALPYDRPNTSMAVFPLCPDCTAEYGDPGDRRFHAEPIACPACGPTLAFAADGRESAVGGAALTAALASLRRGEIVAVKGIGGYHLVCDARDARAVARLREKKRRPAKPLAVMFPLAGKDGLDEVRRHARPDAGEAAAIASPGRPIVLVAKRPDTGLAEGVAPGLAEFGVFLPYSPLHALLLEDFGGPVVATSGNISGEPVLTDNAEAGQRLGTVADAFLHHDRRIVRPADDPVCRQTAGRLRPLRIGRGSAPAELSLPVSLDTPLIAAGGHMKGTVALAWDDRVVVSPHIGEMDSPRSLAVFEQTAADLQRLYGVRAERIACDAHPGYTTHGWARSQGLPVSEVWHHAAHAGALAGETDRRGRWLVFAWDGVGLGEDGTLWGGEALVGRPGAWRRAASLRPFRLPGGERAGREPWRSAAALCWEAGLDWPAAPAGAALAREAWDRGLNCPPTSAAGRLFDAAASLVIGTSHASFEAEGPMRLEALCRTQREPVPLPLAPDAAGVLRSDWQPLLRFLADDAHEPRERAERFHASMAGIVADQAAAIAAEDDVDYVGLTGGVFQNRFLAEQAVVLLEARGFDVVLPAALPCNDAGLSFGQAVELAAGDARS